MNKHDYLEEEVLLVTNSGEIPEIAYHGSIYYLTEDPEGPGLTLEREDLRPLQEAVLARYRKIILRDCTPELRDKRVYRGLARCLANWQRLTGFCRRQNVSPAAIRHEAAAALRAFLERESRDVASGARRSCINCSAADLARLCTLLHVAPEELPPGWEDLCCLPELEREQSAEIRPPGRAAQ